MNDFVVDILSEFLGEPRKHSPEKGQIAFDCPACSEEKSLYGSTDGKGNLEINYQKGYYKCWACYTTNNMKGVIGQLIWKYGNDDIRKRYNLVKPTYFDSDNDVEREIKVVHELPPEFRKLIPNNQYLKGYWDYMNYCKGRGITQKIIDKYNIGFINEGKYHSRIVIPSYDSMGNVNYYICRSILSWAKPKYINSEAEKDEIIFNESLINPYATIYLVEGPMDSIVLPNCIPLLGLFVSDKLFWYLQKNCKANVVIILDGEAKEEANKVYALLNTMDLYDRVRIIYLKEEWDMSRIYQVHKEKGLKAVLTKEKHLNEFDF